MQARGILFRLRHGPIKPPQCHLVAADSSQMNDYLIICTGVYANQPEVFIAKPDEIKNKIHKGIERGQISYWFERKEYERFAGRWVMIKDDGNVLEASSSSNDSLTNAEQ